MFSWLRLTDWRQKILMDTVTLIVCLVFVLGSPLHPAASHPEKSPHPILGNIAVPGGKTQLILIRESSRMSAVEFEFKRIF